MPRGYCWTAAAVLSLMLWVLVLEGGVLVLHVLAETWNARY